MNIFINILVAIICLILGYIFGSIPTGVWIGKIFFHRDPRLEGSNNSGGTNVGRLFGKKVGFLVIILDMIKLIIPVWLAFVILTYAKFGGQYLLPKPREFNNLGFNFDYLIPWPVYWLAALGCSIGHCWPIFADFRGGKNASSYFGLTLSASWLICFGPGIIYLIVLKIKKYVSLASMTMSWSAVLISWIWSILILTGVISGSTVWIICYGPALECNYIFSIILTFEAILLTYQHRDNIKRLKAGNERKITWM